ncbi:MAG: hypothetical protein QXU44_07095 [Candidatus Caldarchaeum sp.]
MVKTIFCEDAYGVGFFRNLIKKIKKAEPHQLGVSIKSTRGLLTARRPERSPQPE